MPYTIYHGLFDGYSIDGYWKPMPDDIFDHLMGIEKPQKAVYGHGFSWDVPHVQSYPLIRNARVTCFSWTSWYLRKTHTFKMGHSIPSHIKNTPILPHGPKYMVQSPRKTMVDTSARATAAAITVASQVLATVKSAKRSSAVLWVSWSMCQDWFGGKVLRKIIAQRCCMVFPPSFRTVISSNWCWNHQRTFWIRPQRKEEQPSSGWIPATGVWSQPVWQPGFFTQL